MTSMNELQFTSFHLLILFLIVFFLTCRKAGKPSNRKLPPGPWKLPVVGNVHQLMSDSSPHEALSKLAKKYGPLISLKLGEVSTIVVSSSEVAKQFLKTHDIDFAQRPLFLSPAVVFYNATNVVFSPYGDYWKQLRKICTMELFCPNRVKSFRRIREEEVLNLITTVSLSQKGYSTPINISEMIFSLIYGITSRAAFGKKYKDQAAFMSVVKEVSKLSSGFCLADLFPSIKFLEYVSGLRRKLEKEHRKADQILENIIKEHKDKTTMAKMSNEEMEEDLVDVLLGHQEHGDLKIPLSDINIKAVILDIFSAGSDTSSAIVEWAMSEMLKNPTTLKKAQAEVRQVFKCKNNVDETYIHELKYLNCIIKETLRLHNPTPLIPRESRTSVEINGHFIPAKTKVSINARAIGQDPEYWTEAEIFYPERFLDSSVTYIGGDFEFIPFGGGRRICPGISYAMANIELPLAQLLFHFDWKLPDGVKNEDLDMSESYGLTVRRKHDLLVVPVPYLCR